MAGSSQPSSGMILVDGAESMLLTFASGALTGVACLAVLRKRLRRDTEAEADADALHVGIDAGACLTPRGAPDWSGQRERDGSVGGAPIFPSVGPLQHAGDVIHQLKSARAAASASVADFKTTLVTLQQLDGGTSAGSGGGVPACNSLSCSQPAQEQDVCCHSLRAAPAEVQEAKQEVLHLSEQLAQALAQLDVAQQQLWELRALRTDLQQGAPYMQTCVRELSQKGSAAGLHHAAAAAQLQVLQDAVQSLERQLQKVHRKMSQQHQQLQKARRKAQQQQQKLQETEQDARQQQALLQQAHDSVAAAEHKSQQVHRQHEAACEQLMLLEEEHSDRLERAYQDKLQLRQAQDEAQAQVQQAAVSTASLKQQLEAAVAEAAASQLALSSAVSCVAAANQQLQQQSQAQQDLQNALVAAVKTSEASHQQVQQLVAEAQQLQQQQLDRQAAVYEMQLQLHAAKACAADKAALVQQLEHQNTQLQHQLRHQQQAAASDAADLQDKVQAAEAAASDYKQQLAVAQADLQEQEQAAEHYSRREQQQLAQLQAQLDAALAQSAEADQQVQGLQATAETRLDMLEASEAQLANAQQELDFLRASAAPPSPSQQQSLAVPASRLTPLGVLEASAASLEPQLPLLRTSTAGKSEQELMQSYAGLINATRRGAVGAPHMLLFDGSLTAATASSTSTTAADSSGAGQQWSWLQAQTVAEAPTGSLLAELQHESDELTEQLAKLQQYLKTSTSSFADLNSIEVMDEGLQVLRKLTDEAVTVAASTVRRVTEGGGVNSALTSVAGRSPSLPGCAPKHKSVAGAAGDAVPDPAAPSAAAAPAVPSVAIRRLGLNLPMLQTWGSGATVSGSPQHLPLSAGGLGHDSYSRADAAAGAKPSGNGNGVTAAQLGLEGCTLDHWGSALSEAACSWLTGDDQHEGPPASSSDTPAASTTGTTAARLPSRLAAVSIGAAAGGDESAIPDARGSGMLPASGAGAAMQQQQQQQQQHAACGQLVQPYDQQHTRPQEGSTQFARLQEQLECALAEVRQLHGERLMLHTQVVHLAELAAQQEDRLAVSDELLTALTTGTVKEG